MKPSGISRYALGSLALLCASVLLLVFSLAFQHSPHDAERSAARLERTVSRRFARLERYVHKEPRRLPEDMVIYRYRSDSLYSWSNRFPILNDDIHSKVVFQRLCNPRLPFNSPLADVSDTVSFCNLGPSWYLVKAVVPEEGSTAIIGLKILDTDSFSVRPLEESGGVAVCVGGVPQFKVFGSSVAGATPSDAARVWLAFALFLIAALLYLAGDRTLKNYFVYATGIVSASIAMYIWGHKVQIAVKVFSPTLFAGGPVLFSLGAVVLANLLIFLLVEGLHMVRRDLYSGITGTPRIAASCAASVLAIAGILVYTHLSLCNVILNSGITLELYKLAQLSVWTAVVYLSYITMLLSVPLLVDMQQPALSRLAGRHFRILGRRGRVVFGVLVSLYLLVTAGTMGFRKEESRAALWADRLAVDRDISLELQLRHAEGPIAADMLIAPLSAFDNAEATVLGRIQDNYLSALSRNYDISVSLLRDAPGNPKVSEVFGSRVRDGIPISEGSKFLYIDAGAGRSSYAGIFVYYLENLGLVHMLLEVEPKSSVSPRGYAGIAGITPPWSIRVPANFSYARYIGRDLLTFKGKYAYPTVLDDAMLERCSAPCHFNLGGYTHFLNPVADGECVIISRPKTGAVGLAISFVFIALFATGLLALSCVRTIRRGGRKIFAASYYKPRIVWVVMTSLILTLVVMAALSVLFVYRSNDSTFRTIMSEKVSSIQTMLQSGIKGVESTRELSSGQTVALINEVGADTSSDITLYTPDGRFLMSTAREYFEWVSPGGRMDSEAYDQIIRQKRRFCLHREKVGRRGIYVMYAPLRGKDDHLLAVLSSPYTGVESYEFERDVVAHSLSILMVFLVLLVGARFVSERIIDRMFKPLSEMSRKMSSAALDTMEQVSYDREDEISSIVQAYNRMVVKLSESSVRLAEAERDKAWSGMARQVAHEIKNPLTPMKLQIQRILRLKQKGDPQWQERFDESAKVLLDHIDILTQTANEFSTFAKLYTEEPTPINLDAVLQEEISMFDNKEGVCFEYVGLSDTLVTGPKPQLTRVFVNLFGNAVQALEGRSDGRVFVALRKSREDGYYDIVVEDNGPGVSAENVSRLFTPNFTTKSGGSGLGLAISRSILQRCGATISYSRSFALGGACFTVKYPCRPTMTNKFNINNY